MTLELATERMLAHVDEYGIGWMTFNNPARHNALSLEMWQGIGDILEYFQNSAAVRAVVMRGAGGKAFVSGADILNSAKNARMQTNAAATAKLPVERRTGLAKLINL